MGLLSNMDEIMEDLTNCKDLFKITQNDYLYNYYVETKQDLKNQIYCLLLKNKYQ